MFVGCQVRSDFVPVYSHIFERIGPKWILTGFKPFLFRAKIGTPPPVVKQNT